MMKQFSIKQILVLLLIATVPTLVWAQNDADTEEISYEQLLSELSAKQKSTANPIIPESDPLDDIDLHAGFSMVNSVINLNADGKDISRYQSGMQLSLGIDLFSPNWTAEGAFRNYGRRSHKMDYLSLREFDLRVFNRAKLDALWGYRLGIGLATSYMKYENEVTGFSRNDTTPGSTFFGGFDAYISRNLSLGFEFGIRTSLLNDTMDKNAVDLSLRMDTYF